MEQLHADGADSLGAGPALDASRSKAERSSCRGVLAAELQRAHRYEEPFRHWFSPGIFPAHVTEELSRLPFIVQNLGGASGTREMHNDTRQFIDPKAISAFPVCRAVAEAFRSSEVIASIEKLTGAVLEGCSLRIEFAQDTDGFWLAPHTDLGVKRFTLLYYLDAGGQPDMGTDLYADAATWVKRAPFEPGAALIFVPSDRTWHGFAQRPILGVRKTLIVNYVTKEWRARRELAFPARSIKPSSIRPLIRPRRRQAQQGG